MISSTHFSTTALRVKHGGCEEYLHVPFFAQGIVFFIGVVQFPYYQIFVVARKAIRSVRCS